MAFTYPITGVKFNKMPSKISVYNVDTNEEFDKIIIEEENKDDE